MDDLRLSFENQLLRSTIEIQEETLRQVSQEIHDSIAHTLALSKLNLYNLSYSSVDSSKGKIEESIQLIEDVIQRLRNISKSLHSDIIRESGLFHALENEINILRKTKLFRVIYNIKGEMFDITPDTALILFRIIQESLNNIIKHAQASEIKLELHFEEQYLRVSIEDNGVGFTINEATGRENGGAGLKNMKQRLEILKGKLEISSAIGKGTAVKLVIPFFNT